VLKVIILLVLTTLMSSCATWRSPHVDNSDRSKFEQLETNKHPYRRTF
jgi:hypothetical protein